MADLTFSRTQRGFLIAEFEDAYGERCSIQQSSHVDPHIWLGVNGGRMHLSQEQVQALMPALVCFAMNGCLPSPEARDA